MSSLTALLLTSNRMFRGLSGESGRRTGEAGVSLIELVVTLAILGILASLVIPSTQMTGKRIREIELKRNLRVIRTAIDDYKRAYDKALSEKKIQDVLNKSGYPKDLKTLVEGDDFGTVDKKKRKFLRRIPIDPFNPPKPGEEPKWGIRAYKDDSDKPATSDNAEDVYDVNSLSEGTAIDGSKYNEW